MSLTALFGTIYGLHFSILTNFYLYLQYFQKEVFNFTKIRGIQTHHQIYEATVVYATNLKVHDKSYQFFKKEKEKSCLDLSRVHYSKRHARNQT